MPETSSNPLMLISAGYDNQKNCATLKFYDTVEHKIVDWRDNTNHMPYCYSREADIGQLLDRDDVVTIKKEKKYDILQGKEIDVNKIVTTNPLAVGGSPNSIRESVDTWESDIRYHQTYIFDTQLLVGSFYKIEKNKVIPIKMDVPEKTQGELKKMWERTSDDVVDKEHFVNNLKEWAELLNQPIPNIKRLAVDIEVENEGKMPDASKADQRITAIGLDGTNDHEIYVLKRDVDMGENVLPKDVNVLFFEDEKSMIEKAFVLIKKYPFILTYNGDDFDAPYLYNRAKKLGIKDEDNPFLQMRSTATLKEGIHLDLFKVFNNRSLQIYAFKQKYTEFGLGTVAKALIGETKIENGKDINDLDHYEIANYCYNDARITLKLTTYDNDLVMNLLILICRISRMTIDELSRVRISQWVKNLLYYEHRKNNELIPKSTEFKAKETGTNTEAVIQGKKYRGAIVMEPQAGVHFKVKVMDFASLYPTIIKVRNLSYESVRCPHEECKSNKIEETDHWCCTKKNGMLALVIGSLRDLRVNYYKVLSLDKSLPEKERNQFYVIREVLKVFLNASYGVTGAETFPLYYLPTAESITAIARYVISSTAENCKKAGITVLYGDTDSLFTKNAPQEKLNEVVNKAKELYAVELEVDKEYKYVVLSGRKKNYFGVLKNGKVDVKGLTGKKSHTPKFIKTLFDNIKEILSKVETPEQFEEAKTKISERVGDYGKKLENKELPLEDMAFHYMLSKDPGEYIKNTPQHIKAVRMLETPMQKGEIISYIKTRDRQGVKPVEIARPDDIDVSRYLDFMESTLEQIIEPMNLNFERMLGKPTEVTLDSFFR